MTLHGHPSFLNGSVLVFSVSIWPLIWSFSLHGKISFGTTINTLFMRIPPIEVTTSMYYRKQCCHWVSSRLIYRFEALGKTSMLSLLRMTQPTSSLWLSPRTKPTASKQWAMKTSRRKLQRLFVACMEAILRSPLTCTFRAGTRILCIAELTGMLIRKDTHKQILKQSPMLILFDIVTGLLVSLKSTISIWKPLSVVSGLLVKPCLVNTLVTYR